MGKTGRREKLERCSSDYALRYAHQPFLCDGKTAGIPFIYVQQVVDIVFENLGNVIISAFVSLPSRLVVQPTSLHSSLFS